MAGQPEAARTLVTHGAVTIKPYRELAGTYGSDLRDRAMILEAVVTLGLSEQVGPLMKGLSDALTKNEWLSTQETAYALLALSRCASAGNGQSPITFSYAWNAAQPVSATSSSAIVQRKLKLGDKTQGTLTVKNAGGGGIYPRLVTSGLPAVGQEQAAANGLTLEVLYQTLDGKALDPSTLEQGTDLKVVVKVTNSGVRGALKEVALSHVFPSGWEIRNERMDLTHRRPPAGIEYQDVRDDRVYTYFEMASGETKTIEVLANASYLGKFYLPMISVEPMYDATINARTKGQWIQVTEAGAR